MNNREIEDFFDKFVSNLDLPLNCFGGLKRTRRLCELVQINKDKHILEVGCGTGTTSCYIAKLYNCRVTALDISSGMLGRSAKRARKEGMENRIRFVKGDERKLPFKNESFDCVISENATDWEMRKALKEYVRVTKKRRLCWNLRVFYQKKPPKELIQELYEAGGHLTGILTLEELEETFSDSGLSKIKFEVVNNNIRTEYFKYFWHSLLPYFPEILFRLSTHPVVLKFLVKKNYLHVFWKHPEYFGSGIFVGRK